MTESLGTGSKLPLRGTTLSGPFGQDAEIMAFFAEERISGPFHCSLEIISPTKDLDFSSIVGESATVSIELPSGSLRYFNGVVSRFRQAGHTVRLPDIDKPQCYYYAELRPKLWLLTKGSDCKIFQNQTIPAIISTVTGIVGQTVSDGLTGTYVPREYCVQYNETHYDFICRLCEEEGISFYFTHADGDHTMVIVDAPSAIAPCPGAAELKYEQGNEAESVNIVYRGTIEESVVHGEYVHDDFNFETPSTDLVTKTAGVHGSSPTKRSVFEYPGGFLKTDRGTSLGKVRIEELETLQRVFKAQSLSPGLLAGGKFTLSDHFRSDLNGDYTVTRVSHTADADAYTNSFEAIPSNVPFRPSRATRKPTIAGPQTAIVVGPSGEEIHTDKYGRVKVQFHWDRLGPHSDKSSCWVRVAHGWAGKSWGQIYIPRIDQEVVVTFEEGDPDRPLITGSVYNSEQVVPYKLPTNQTQSGLKTRSTMKGSTETFNELRFEDKKGEEQIYFHAEKDFERVVENDDTLKVGFDTKDPGSQTIDIFQDRTTTLDKGNDKLQIKEGNRDLIIDKGNLKLQVAKGNRELLVDTGTDTISIKGDRSVTISEGGHTLTLDKGDQTVSISMGNQTIEVPMGKSSTEAMQSIELKVGSNSLKIDMVGITIKGTMVKIEGTAMAEMKSPLTTVKGDGVVKVDSSGLLMVKGAILKFG